MPKMTLLSMVQNILSAMDSDEVNSIHDTVESFQVAHVVKETFEEQFNNIVIPEHRNLLKLESVSDVTKPNYLKMPPNVKSIEWLKYRNDQTYGRFMDVEFLSPQDFWERYLDFSYNNEPAGSMDLITDFSGIEYYVKNNKQPNYYTMVDDLYLIFDSYDSDYDTTLQSSKSFCWGTIEPAFQLEDDYIPFIDSNLFPLLLAEAKSTCFINFKQITSSKEEQRARRQRIRMQNDQYRDKQAQHKRGVEWNYARNR